MGLKDVTNITINPATDDSVILLRRMVKIMESQATVDAQNRQKINIDAMGTAGSATTSNITVPVTLSGSPTVTLSSQAVTLTSTAVTTLNGQNQQMFQDPARMAYAVGIRNNLTFS